MLFQKTTFPFFLFVLLFLSSCSGDQNDKKKKRLPNFPVIQVEHKDLTGYSTYPASLEGIQNIEIRPKIQGFIEKIYVDEGKPVKKGQLLFRLEAQPLDAQAQAASDAIRTAQANANAAQLEVEKLEPLVKKGIISDVELQTANTDLAAANASLEQSRNNYRSVKRNVNYKNVTSPIDGIVATIPNKLGALVSATDPVPLTTVSNTSEMYAYFSLNEKDYVSFLKNTEGKTLKDKVANFPEIILRLADGSEYKHKGKIQTSIAHVNPNTGTIEFRAIFPNPERLLANGNSGTILIPKRYNNALVVPEQSTYEDQTLVYVFKLNKGDTLTRERIEVETRIDNFVLVEEGLKKGDTILGKGLNQVQDKTKIKPKLVPMDSIAGSIDKLFKM